MFDWLNKLYGKDARRLNGNRDLEDILNRWPLDTKNVTARTIKGYDGQPLLQLRLDCGVLQMFLDGRPDGLKPHKCQTFLEYLEHQINEEPDPEVDSEETARAWRRAWPELDREMNQYYHRRLGLLAVARTAQEEKKDELARQYYRRAARDAEYTLHAMDFIRDHSDDEDHIEDHERFRPFVLWHWTIAQTQQKILDKNFDQAIEQVKQGMGDITKVYEDHGLKKWLKHDPSMAELRTLEKQIRKLYNIKSTLHEQLADALAREDYETAAKLRDQLKAQAKNPSPSSIAHGERTGF